MNIYDSIQYMNVYSKEYTFHYSEMGQVMQKFVNLCKENQLKKNGNLFYAVKNIEKDGNTKMEFFIPAQSKNGELTGELRFHTYFIVDNMLSVVVMDEVEKNMETAYAAILEYAKNNRMKIVSPFFNEVCGNKEKKYIIVKVAIKKEDLK